VSEGAEFAAASLPQRVNNNTLSALPCRPPYCAGIYANVSHLSSTCALIGGLFDVTSMMK